MAIRASAPRLSALFELRTTTIAPPLLTAAKDFAARAAPSAKAAYGDAFVGAFDRSRWRAPLPRVHCYCFSKAEDPAADVIARAEAVLGCALPNAQAHVVRDVSPHKLMMCLSFELPDAVAWADELGGPASEHAVTITESAEECVKRQRTDQ